MRRRGATAPIVAPSRGRAPLLAALDAQTRVMRKKVQIAKKQLALTDDDYRAILVRVTGKASSTDCGPSHLDELLKEFRRLGWKAVAPKGGGARRPLPRDAQIRMIHAVWNDISPLVAEGGPDALRAFVRRQTKSEAHPDGISAPEFLDSVQANKVLEGLKAWRSRLQTPKAARP